MKILFTAPRFHSNQIGWVDALGEAGHKVHYLVCSPRVQTSMFNNQITNLEVGYLSGWLIKIFSHLPILRVSLFYFPKFSFFQAEFAKNKPDFLVIRDPHLLFSLQSYRLAKKYNVPTVLYTQTEYGKQESFLCRLFQFFNLLPKLVITPVIPDHGSLSEIIDSHREVPLVIKSNQFIKKDNETLKILCVAKYTLERKKLLVLLKAFNKLQIKSELTIVGAYSDRGREMWDELNKYIDSNNIRDKVNLLRNIPHEKMSDLYKGHDLFVLPSIEEPYGVSVLEAMSYGLPTIVTDSVGARHCLESLQSDLIVSGNSVDDLAQKIAILLTDQDSRLNHQKISLGHIENFHSPEYFLERFMSVYEEVKNLR